MREGYVLLEMLKTKPKRRIRPAALKRWFEARYGGGRSDNPWETLLSQFIDEIEMAWADEYIPSSWLIDELFEFGNEARRSQRGRIVISTVHGAKGREFRHVTILDGGDWRDASDDERRLYYVGMTRAKENLVLCQGTQRSNPWRIQV